ncbi:MAG TPA: hypothetical protein VK158_01390 [Acidobacteriota bacterium]|nr:hypothetical protein [Acidobacteriota bacterium]
MDKNGLGGCLILYYLYTVYLVLFLAGFVLTLYNAIVAGPARFTAFGLFIISMVQAILLARSLELLYEKRKGTRSWTIASLTTTFVLFSFIAMRSTESINALAISLSLLVFSLIWMIYFITSRRVHNTFIH